MCSATAKSIVLNINDDEIDGGFWLNSTIDTFVSVADELLEYGLSPAYIQNMLAQLYSAVADEFGC